MQKTYGLTHIAFHVKDLEETFTFYREVFGAVLGYRDETSLQVQTAESKDNLAFELSPEKAGVAGGVIHFGFRTTHPAHVETLASLAERHGGAILRTGEFMPGMPNAYVSDPNGYEIEIWFE